MSVLTIGIAGLMLGVGTFAYFSDTESVSGTIAAGTLDIVVNENWGRWDFPLVDWAPGDSTANEIILITNDGGSIMPNHLEVKVTTRDFSDGGVGAANGEDYFEKYITVTNLNVQKAGGGNYNNLLDDITDIDHDGKITLYELEEYGVIDDIPVTDAEMTFKIALEFSSDADNRCQRDSLTIEFTFGAAQAPGQNVL